jgi:hypothetical protein
MKTTSIANKTNTPLLSEEQTTLFIEAMKNACQSLNAKAVAELFEEFSIHNFDDKDEFINDAFERLAFDIKHPKGIEVKSVTPFTSRCSACTLGKSVSAYRVIYLKHNDTVLPGQFLYELTFAINFTLKHNELMDVSWCNFFLNQKEIQEISM